MVSFPRSLPSFIPLHGCSILPVCSGLHAVIQSPREDRIPGGRCDWQQVGGCGRLQPFSTGRGCLGLCEDQGWCGHQEQETRVPGSGPHSRRGGPSPGYLGAQDIEASGLSGPTPPPFPEEVGVVRVPKVKEGVSVASSPLLPFCILRGPQSPASFPPPNCHCKPEGNPKPHVHRRSLSQQEGVGEPRAPSAARSGSRSQWSALFIHGNFHSGAFRVGPTCGSDSSTGSELRILRASVSQP